MAVIGQIVATAVMEVTRRTPPTTQDTSDAEN